MRSGLVKFQEIIEDVKDDTGIHSMRNLYNKIRRLIYRCQKDIGFGESVILRKIVYRVSDGSIVGNKVLMPEDFIKMESYGTCEEGMCPGSYNHQGNYIFFCEPDVQEFTLVYYALLCDGEGWPMVSENHREAVVSGIAHWLYKPKVFNGEGSMNVFKEMERYYEDRIAEARGMDVWPSTEAEWDLITANLTRSRSQSLIYDQEKGCYCCVEESINPYATPETNSYWWQYNSLSDDIALAMGIDQAFLDAQNNILIPDFELGKYFDYTTVGRIGFAITGIEENTYAIFDILNNDITSIVFDTYYNTTLQTQIYISKEYYSISNIFFKLKLNS